MAFLGGHFRRLDVAFVLLRQGTSADFQEGSLTGFCVADRYGERPRKGLVSVAYPGLRPS